ncbi:MAG: hypothetical protein ACRDZO_17985 [Egibacteraceae bacterium]
MAFELLDHATADDRGAVRIAFVADGHGDAAVAAQVLKLEVLLR